MKRIIRRFRAWGMAREITIVHTVEFFGLRGWEQWHYGFVQEGKAKRYLLFEQGANNAVLWDMGRVKRKAIRNIAGLASERNELKRFLGDTSPKIEEWEEVHIQK